MGNLTIYKSNTLIEAGYRLSLAEQRIIILSLGQVDSRDVTQKKVTLHAKDYAKEWGVSEVNAMREMRQAANRLFERYITLSNSDETIKFRWIQSVAKYHKGEARISFSFSDDILPFLFELDFKLGVTKYELLSVSGFSSIYSFRLYELAVKMFKMKNKTIGLNDLRTILQLENKYAEYKEFNKFVLKPALSDINEKSDLLLAFEPIKQGRKIVALEFISAKKAVKKDEKSAKSEPQAQEKTRKIYGVFDEICRPQVAKGSDAETQWINKNLGRAYKAIRELGFIKAPFVDEKDLPNIPTEWLKVLKKYCSVVDHYTARDIADELHKRQKEQS